jgi:hypothetical protein
LKFPRDKGRLEFYRWVIYRVMIVQSPQVS